MESYYLPLLLFLSLIILLIVLLLLCYFTHYFYILGSGKEEVMVRGAGKRCQTLVIAQIYISVTKPKGCSRHLFSPTDRLPQITIVVSKLPIQLYLYFTNYPTPLYYIYKLPHPTILYLQITLPHYTQCCYPIRNFWFAVKKQTL